MDKRKQLDRNNVTHRNHEENLSNDDLINMLTKLENNHRRLLGVTSALTEALENTVRGNPFELEETLNKCMEIYPELFTVTIKRPSKNSNFRKTYNTSVSEDMTDTGETEKKIYPSFQIQSDTEQPVKNTTKKQKRPFSFSKETQIKQHYSTEANTPKTGFSNPAFVVTKSNDSNSESLPTQNKKYSKIPKIYKEPSFEILLSPNDCQLHGDRIQPQHNQINLSAFPTPSPDLKNQSFSFHLSENESSVFISPVSEKEFNLSPCDQPTHKTESSYTVKHPESDTDHSTHNKDYYFDSQYEKHAPLEEFDNVFSPKNINLHLDNSDREQEANAENNNSNWPYEIIVQKKGRQKDEENTELSIKIMPDGSMVDDWHSNTAQENHSPVETCIIIKQQFSPNFRGTSNYQIENTSEEVIFNGPREKISVTIAKLQSLSTGLRVQSGVLHPMQGETSQHQGSQSNRKNSPSNYEYPTKIALLNSYNINSSPRHKDKPSDVIKTDFINIKKNLIEGSVKERSQILQSLRLNLIHTLAKERSILLDSYIANDIFDINCNPTLLDILMPVEIINGWDLILQQTILKFLNTVSSMWKGRDYLTSNLKTLACLQKYFFDKYSMRVSSENICKDMLVATFHKLSTRQSQQIALINAGVSEKILFSVLENRETISAYRLLHSLGLLINLCVNSQGRQLMEPMSSELLSLLSSLLQSKENKIVPYAARLLYILMASDKFHKEAKSMDISKILDRSIKVSNKRIKLQLETLKAAMEHPTAHNHLNDAEEAFLENIEAEIDELEEEVEVGEPGVTNAQSESYQKPGMGSAINIRDESRIPPEFAPSKTDEKKNAVKDSNMSLQGAADEDKKSNDETTSILSIEDGYKTSAESKNDKTDKKGKNKKTTKKKRDKDTDSLLSSNYALLKEALDNIIDNQTNYNIIPETVSEEMLAGKNVDNSNLSRDELRKQQEAKAVGIFKEIELAEKHESVSSSIQEIKEKKEEIKSAAPTPDTKKEDKLTPLPIKKDMASSKSRPPSQKSDHVTLRSRKHSIYSQDGNNDYDYCEDTKQIQVPVQHHNLFSDSRQSPYKGLFSDNKDTKKLPGTTSPEKETKFVSKPDSPKETKEGSLVTEKIKENVKGKVEE